MRLRRALLTLSATLLLIAATAGAGICWLKYAPRSTPPEQSALFHLDTETLPALRESFNASDGETRVIVLLSPT